MKDLIRGNLDCLLVVTIQESWLQVVGLNMFKKVSKPLNFTSCGS